MVQLRCWISCILMSRTACDYLKLHQLELSVGGSETEMGEVAGGGAEEYFGLHWNRIIHGLLCSEALDVE